MVPRASTMAAGSMPFCGTRWTVTFGVVAARHAIKSGSSNAVRMSLKKGKGLLHRFDAFDIELVDAGDDVAVLFYFDVDGAFDVGKAIGSLDGAVVGDGAEDAFLH